MGKVRQLRHEVRYRRHYIVFKWKYINLRATVTSKPLALMTIELEKSKAGDVLIEARATVRSPCSDAIPDEKQSLTFPEVA